MVPRPGQIRYLVKGKAIGAKSLAGFVDTFNWMLSWIYNFKVGPGLKIKGARAGTPRLSLTLMNADGVPIDDGGEDTPDEITGEGGGGPTIPGPFEPVYANGVLSGLTNCIFCAERQFVDIGDQTISGSDGYVVLTITHPAVANVAYSMGSVGVEVSLPTNANPAVTKIPLFHITGGKVDIDLRAVPTGVLAR